MNKTGYFMADDWGMSPGINAGILELARRGWLGGVSIMANARFLETGLDELKAFSNLRFSLHLNFTYGRPISHHVPSLINNDGIFFDFKRFSTRVMIGKIFGSEMEIECEAQIRQLRDLQVPINGIDGHHHIHLNPFVYGQLWRVWRRHKLNRIRVTNDGEQPWSYLQSWWALRNGKLVDHGFELDFCRHLLERDLESKSRFEHKLKRSPLIVHPALYDDFHLTGMNDQLKAERVHELEKVVEYLS